jgi:hypothetical protein
VEHQEASEAKLAFNVCPVKFVDLGGKVSKKKARNGQTTEGQPCPMIKGPSLSCPKPERDCPGAYTIYMYRRSPEEHFRASF